MVAPSDSPQTSQWFIVAGTSEDTVSVVSTVDGRRLRYYDGTYVGLAPAGNEQLMTQWRLVEDKDGWYFLERPQNNKRLRMAGGTPVIGSSSGSSDDYKWRFVIPMIPEPTTLHPLSSFETWAATYLAGLSPEDQTPEATPNNDGVSNLQRYAFGTADTRNPIQIVPSTANPDHFTVAFQWNWRASDYRWQIRSGETLEDMDIWAIAVPLSQQYERMDDVDLIELTFPMVRGVNRFYRIEVVPSMNGDGN